MEKIDVIVQSYRKPESLIYTLLSLKKCCGEHIDTIYIDDDQSNDGTIDLYNEKLIKTMEPIKILVRVNQKKSGYTHTCMTWKAFKKKTFFEKIQLFSYFFINRIKFYKTSDDIRYQWGINHTNKKYVFIIHEDIKFYADIIGLYLNCFANNPNLAIVGDLGGSKRCEFGPCFEKDCNPSKIMNGYRPCKDWPLTGKEKNFIYKIIGRKSRHCRINEWCCMLDVEKAKILENKYGVYFGNYEGGGDVGTFWFEKAIHEGFDFIDPLPKKEMRLKYYLHWWQGYEGHSIWINNENKYNKEFIADCLKKEFKYEIN